MRSQNGISACCSTALSGALLLGATFLSALTDPTLSHSALQMVQVVRPFFNSLTFYPGNTEGETEYALSQKSHYEVELALMECLRLLAPVSAEVVPVAPIREGNCGTPAAVLLQSLGDKEKVTFDPPLLLNCPMVVALGHWLESAQPAAKEAFNSPIAQVIGSSYSCRTAYNRPDTRLSQHAFANAVDLPVLILANRQQIDIAKEWGATRHDLAVAKRKLAPVTNLSEHQIRKRIPNNAEAVVPAGKSTTLAIAAYASTLNETSSSKAKVASLASLTNSLSTPQAKFLRRIHQAACRWFSTVLGPEANEEHRNHLHLDLQTRDSLNVCE
jgi:hypothetical protein